MFLSKTSCAGGSSVRWLNKVRAKLEVAWSGFSGDAEKSVS